MKTLIIALLILVSNVVFATDCIDPSNPDCVNTNGSGTYTNSWTPQPLPPGSLQFSFISHTSLGEIGSMGVTNTYKNSLYVLEESTNLVNWSAFTVEWTNVVGAQKTFAYTNTHEINTYYRIKYTGKWVAWATPFVGSGATGGCPGFYIGYAIYRPDGETFAYQPSTNSTTVHRWFDGAGRTDTKIEYLGRFGDIGCGPSPLSIAYIGGHLYSPRYAVAIYFYNNLPTNAYPIIAEGFDPIP